MQVAQAQRASLDEELNSIRQELTDQSRQTQNRNTELGSSLEAAQARIDTVTIHHVLASVTRLEADFTSCFMRLLRYSVHCCLRVTFHIVGCLFLVLSE